MSVVSGLETSRVNGGRERAEVVASATIPTAHGPFRFVVFRRHGAGAEHVAMVRGDVAGTDVLVRVHSECLTSEVFASVDCPCAADLNHALQRIASEGRGVVVYLRRGKSGGDAAAEALLHALGVVSVRLLTGEETELVSVEELGTLSRPPPPHAFASHHPQATPAASVPPPHHQCARASLPSGALP